MGSLTLWRSKHSKKANHHRCVMQTAQNVATPPGKILMEETGNGPQDPFSFS